MSLSIGSTFKEKATQSIKGMAIATTMFTAFPHAANANEAGEAANDHPGAPVVTNTSTASLPNTVQPEIPTRGTKKEAFRASKGRAVYYHGDNMMDVDLLAAGLSNKYGYDIVVIGGGKDDEVVLIVDYRIIPGVYDQRDVDRGVLGDDTTEFYHDRIGPPKKPTNPIQTVSADAPESGL